MIKGIKRLPWVAQSPGLKLIEHSWKHLDMKVRAPKNKKKQQIPASVEQLQDQVWLSLLYDELPPK